jgi:inosine-uridine nucleoside N-ribohydrolase/formylmethanofuran dehydrogenase subunit E
MFINMEKRNINIIIHIMFFISIEISKEKNITYMKKLLVFSLVVIFSLEIFAQPIPVKLKHSVIIDTDGAIDDMRAISLLLSRPEITIRAVLLSDGSLTPDESSEKVSSLFHEFMCDSIPVAHGEILEGVNPPWREFSRQVIWSSEASGRSTGLNAVDCLSDKLTMAKEKIILVCLGPLTNIGQLIRRNPSLLALVERIIWYNDSVKPMQGFNYECDKVNADFVFRSGVRLDVISNLNNNTALFDTSMYNVCRRSKTHLGSILYYVHSQQAVSEKLNQNHFRLCDELVALYLTNPELFGMNTLTDKLNVRYNGEYSAEGVEEAICDMINGKYVSAGNVVFNGFPDKPEMFSYDIRPIIDSAISLYGPDEWKANVMTDEFHGHLGVFSIVGAKMGIRARELFGVGTDMLEVTTYAGLRPPYSCLNDGIQVSTGATLGMGTINVSADSIVRPEAVFTHKGRSIRISLKKEYLGRVDSDINEGIVKFGLMDDGYWKLIRHNALKYWLEWDRKKIFDITEIGKKE